MTEKKTFIEKFGEFMSYLIFISGVFHILTGPMLTTTFYYAWLLINIGIFVLSGGFIMWYVFIKEGE